MEEIKEKLAKIWSVLSKINVNDHLEKKKTGNGVELSYLSWAWAWDTLKENFPDATWGAREWDGKPYLFDPNLGYMVQTWLIIEGVTLTMFLPVMDGSNKAQKDKPYTYKTSAGEKTVEAATMFDINTAIMRCLVKNMAMFGLGHYIYAGEDLPKEEAEEKRRKDAETLKEAVEKLNTVKTKQEAESVFNSFPALKENEEFREVFRKVYKSVA